MSWTRQAWEAVAKSTKRKLRASGGGGVGIPEGRVIAAQLVVYGGFNALTLRAVIEQPWFKDTSYFWRDWPSHVPS